MKHILIIITAFLFFVVASCKNDVIPKPSGAASLTIVNAIVNSSYIIPNFNSHQTLQYFTSAAQIYDASSMEFSSYVGNVPLALYDISDTTHAIYNSTISIPNYSIHSLFLTGTLSTPDNLYTTDNVPNLEADSACAIRFVNLSPGSSPISVDQMGEANGSEVTSLAYKAITGFKKYAATYNISAYNFEVRDVASGTVLATYSFSGVNNGDDGDTNRNYVRHHSFTIVFYGAVGSQGTFLVNDY
jgi:hypothetical protein